MNCPLYVKTSPYVNCPPYCIRAVQVGLGSETPKILCNRNLLHGVLMG